MPRTLDPAAHAVRREAFVDVGQRLIQAKGYEQMSIQDVLDELDASRGAFYHYFESKADLLEAVIDRMADSAIGTIAPTLDDPTVPAPVKLAATFAGIGAWKTARKDLVLAILAIWLSDDNAIVREKLRRDVVARLAPLLATIVVQGCAEGTFTVATPAESARVLASVIQGASDAALELFVGRQDGTVAYETVERTFAAYTEAFERILGAPPGSLALADPAMLREWFG